MARYEILRPIGRGGMGVVYEALDRERQQLVALKTLRHFTPAALYLFKREFRALADVHHPNLVNLYELVVAESHRAFFTMELVRGTDFLSYVRQGPTARLRPAFRQLVEGIRALHRAGKLHRDIKPSNVRVTPEGRVVLLDFGVATELAPTSGEAPNDPCETAGTTRYMAPELSRGGPPTAASDWYSVGVIIHQILLDGLDGAQPELDALRDDILRRDPSLRPGGDEIARRIGGPVDPPPVTAEGGTDPDAGAPFVGREASLAILRRAFEDVQRGGSIAVRVSGPSGMGKSTLVRTFLDGLGDGEALILRGRAYERESVPYKAMDSVVDALSRRLMRLDLRPLPAGADALARLFPVLRRVPALRDLTAPLSEAPHRARGRAFAALRELLRSLATQQALVVSIDDAHWGDADSATLLIEVMRPPDPPPILLIASYRDEEAERSAFLIGTGARWPAGAEVRAVPVGPLEPHESRLLALTLLGSRGDDAAETIARESGGSPFLIEELARYEPARRGRVVKLEELVSSRLAHIPDDARRMLEVIAVGGRPLPVSVVAEASGLQRAVGAAIDIARAHRFVRTGLRHGLEVVETIHDRIRDLIVAQLSESTVRAHHRRLADALSSVEGRRPRGRRRSLPRCGRRRARCSLRRTRRRASRGQARLRSRREPPPAGARQPLPSVARAARAVRAPRRGARVVGAGLGGRARLPPGGGARRIDGGAPATRAGGRRAAPHERPYRRGRRGVEARARGCEREGAAEPSRSHRLPALLSASRERSSACGSSRASAALTSPVDRLTIDALLAFVMGFSIVDVVISSCMQARHLMFALRRGSSVDVMRAASIELTHAASVGGPVGERERELERIIESVAAETDDAEAIAFVRAARGTALILRGRWREAIETLDASYANLSARRAGWQSNANVFAAFALYCMGDLQALAPRQARVLADAQLRGDLYSEVSLRTVTVPALCLAADDPDAARGHVREAMARWTHRGFLVQHWQAMRAEAEIELYVGDATAARERLRRDAIAIRRSFLLESQFLRISHSYVRGRCAIASAIADPTRRARRSSPKRDARRVTSNASALRTGAPLAALLQAGIASVAGDRGEAARSLREAIALATRAELGLQAEAARYQLARLLGGDEGRDLLASRRDGSGDAGSARPLALRADGRAGTVRGGRDGPPRARSSDEGPRPVWRLT